MLAHWAAERAAVRSLEVTYALKIIFVEPLEGGGVIRGQEQRVTYRAAGEKFRQESQVEYNGVGIGRADRKSTTIVAFDGHIATRQDMPRPGILSQGSGEDTRRKTSPDPVQFVAIIGPDEFAAKIASGEYRLLSAENAVDQNKPVIRVELQNLSTGFHAIVSYSTREEFLPIHLLDVNGDGGRVGEVIVDKVAQVAGDDGNTFFYPVHASRKSWDLQKKTEVDVYELSVDEKSIHINLDLDESIFRIKPANRGRVYDADARRWLRNEEREVVTPATTPILRR